MPMRVLHIVSTGGRRGAELFAGDLISVLKREGVDQRLAVLRGSEPVEVRYEAPISIIGHDRAQRTLRVKTIRSLSGLIRAWEPHIIQAHGGEALKYSFLSDRKARERLIYRRIGSVHARTTFGARKAAYGAMMRRVPSVVALADRVRRETIDTYGVLPERIVTIPNGIDPARIEQRRPRDQVRASLGVSPRASVVLSLGALTWEKDPLLQVEIAGRIVSGSSEVVFLLAGDGPLNEQVSHAIARKGLSRRVLPLGNRSDVGDLLHSSDLLLLTSRTEGVPGAVIEAGMAGIPTAAFAVGGIAEVVQSGVTGLLARPGDHQALTGHLRALIDDEDRRKEMGRSAAEWCRSRFDVRFIAPQYLRLYERLVSRSKAVGSNQEVSFD
jgi:glycosyltransferase involved in cell wall biosynthesis